LCKPPFLDALVGGHDGTGTKSADVVGRCLTRWPGVSSVVLPPPPPMLALAEAGRRVAGAGVAGGAGFGLPMSLTFPGGSMSFVQR
jgi:hypothetical protein